MNTQMRRARMRVATALLASAMTMSACGGSAATETAAEPAATETTLAATPVETTAAPAEAEPVDDGAAAADEAAEAARAVGRTGPIRELPALSFWTDVDLHPFLADILNMPVETPIPDGVVLTYATVRQNFNETGSGLSFEGGFMPTFDRDGFEAAIGAVVDPAVWTASGVTEDLENNSVRLEFTNDDPTFPYWRVSFTYTDADAENQAELWISAAENKLEARTQRVINSAFFDWMAVFEVEPTLTDWFTSVNLGRLPGKIELDMRFNGPVGAFETMSAFYAAPTFAEITPVGEQEYDDRTFQTNDTPITDPNGFDGQVKVTETDPEDEIIVMLRGSYDLS